MLSARDLRVEEAVPFTKRFAARWVFAHGVLPNRADDVESDCLFAMVILAGEWDETRGVPWMRFLSTRIKHRLIDELRSRYGRAGFPGTAGRRTVHNAGELFDRATIIEPGYAQVDHRDQLDRLLAPHALRTQRIVRARIAGWTLVEIAAEHGLSTGRVSQLIQKVRPDVADLTVVRAVVAVAPNLPG